MVSKLELIYLQLTFLDANAIVKDNANPVTYEGFRASLATEINDNWDALVSVASQDY